ncbi:unnamed protein product [Clonostachys rhizophaga]|uniref:Glutamate carboxypeptidase II n=1 Tax=Clonostachys rhizophaga TaxID=160324 RepID=A0A9N9UZM7_9HYPO|nr:unnamed protein product [Clonostachys rhizophaga]
MGQPYAVQADDKLARESQLRPRWKRSPRGTYRRFLTIGGACLLLTGVANLVSHSFSGLTGHHCNRDGRFSQSRGQNGQSLSYQELESIFLETPSSELAEKWLYYYTSGPHLAGKNLSQAEWTRDRWEEWGVSSEIVSYDTYINYPVDHSLSLLREVGGDGNTKTWEVAFKASLEEDVLEDDPTTALEDRIPTFHGYSASGNVTASFVYVNYGTYQDYQDLVDAGIQLEGKIAIAKYGGIFRGLKVKRAQELGVIGVLIYSDPGDDGEYTIANGYDSYPKGPARHPNSVQRGSVEFLSVSPGDPTTPGWPSKPGAPRAPPHNAIPSIPSIPISYTDALPILKALNGHGPKGTDLNKYWGINNGLGYAGVEYFVGPSPDDVVLNLYNDQEYVTTPLWNVIGIVNGTIPNEVIIVGNHRDAWIAGGASDPNSGSAVINEVIRGVGKALEAGWKPLRTIVFASWDGEEYGLIGSTEWVEEYLPWIQDANVAYINLDVAVSGDVFHGGATPTLHKLLRDSVGKVLSPNQTIEGQTIGDLWDGVIPPLGSGSDFTAFQDYAGVPALDIGFKANPKSPVYHYHSNYDSFHWMSILGDPGFKYHKAASQLLGLIVANLVDSIVIPLQATAYADALDKYLDGIETQLGSTAEPVTEAEIFVHRAKESAGPVQGSSDAFKDSLFAIREAIQRLHISAERLDGASAWINQQLEEGIPWWNFIKKAKVALAILSVNKKYKLLERNLLYEGGLDGRPWFKHVVYAPGLWTGYSGAVFPGLTESIDADDYISGLKWAGIIKKAIDRTSRSIH